jgi:ABC-2 type transport system ATP-binding protein
MIEVMGVGHDYGSRTVLDGLTLRVETGSIVGLVGPNGAGKSTLFRAIATLLVPSRGAIRVGGADVRREPVLARRKLGYLPERDNPYGDLTCEEYLDLFAEIAGLATSERRSRIPVALAEAGVFDRRGELIAQLSKGLRQRLALQSLLIHRPHALLLDEPTDGLDPQSRELVCQRLRSLADQGCAVLVSSHVLEELERIADRTIALVAGRAAELRAPQRRSWILRVRGDPAVARVISLGAVEVVDASVEGDALTVELRAEVPDAAAVVTALIQAGIQVLTVAERTPSLRELYNQALEASA